MISDFLPPKETEYSWKSYRPFSATLTISYCSSVARADCQLETLPSSERRQLTQYSGDFPSQA
ncbi:TPA: hypothetical protein ACXNJ0_005466, partial [Klebsiella pneumoniae]